MSLYASLPSLVLTRQVHPVLAQAPARSQPDASGARGVGASLGDPGGRPDAQGADFAAAWRVWENVQVVCIGYEPVERLNRGEAARVLCPEQEKENVA